MTPSRLALVTDAWHPQTNGVVNTLSTLVTYLRDHGDRGAGGRAGRPSHRAPAVLSGDRSSPCDPWKAIARMRGVRARRGARRHRGAARALGPRLAGAARACASPPASTPASPSTCSARLPVPLSWGYALERWFHGRRRAHAGRHAVADERAGATAAVGRRLVHWPRGVDTELFHPRRTRATTSTRARARSGSTSAASRSRRASRTSSSCRSPAPRWWSATVRRARACSAASPTSSVPRLALRRRPGRALRERRLLRVPVAHRDLRQRDPGGAGVGPAGRLGAGAGSLRPRRRRRQRRADDDLAATRACARSPARRERPRAPALAGYTLAGQPCSSSARTWSRSCGRVEPPVALSRRRRSRPERAPRRAGAAARPCGAPCPGSMALAQPERGGAKHDDGRAVLEPAHLLALAEAARRRRSRSGRGSAGAAARRGSAAGCWPPGWTPPAPASAAAPSAQPRATAPRARSAEQPLDAPQRGGVHVPGVARDVGDLARRGSRGARGSGGTCWRVSRSVT